jgi:Peptidase A4 family
MRRATLGGICAAFAVAAMFNLTGAASARTQRGRHVVPRARARASRARAGALGTLVPARRGEAIPRRGGTVDSLNWSGYAVTPAASDVTSVSSTFTVPSAGLVPPGFAATWTGIGGYSSSDLIQAGTAEQSVPGNPLLGAQYYAWYELLPASETQLTGCTPDPDCTVDPGDEITVQISLVAGDTWSIAMNDAGRWSWSKDVDYSSSQSSGEWILEAPTLVAQTTLADVGTVHFGPTSTYTAGGAARTIAQGDPTQIVLSPGVVDEATPSALAADGQSFDDCAYAQSCAPPS